MDIIETTESTSTAEAAGQDEATLVKFKIPHKFEGKTYTEVDLSGLDRLSAEDMIQAEKYLNRKGISTVLPELTLEYICFIASMASDQPIEFFKQLHPRNVARLKNAITDFFYGED